MQNISKIVNVLPSLPTELNIIVLQPPTADLQPDLRYQRQYRADFRVRRACIVTWLRFLKLNHPDYRDIEISAERVNALPVDDNVFSSMLTVPNSTFPTEDTAVTDLSTKPTAPCS